MTSDSNTYTEGRLAEEIVSVLPSGSVARVLSGERDAIRFRVRSTELKLTSVVLRRTSLTRLSADPLRDIKIEYLRRDLLAAAQQRIEFRYPHPVKMAPRGLEWPALPICASNVC